jgi:hypothetical protein
VNSIDSLCNNYHQLATNQRINGHLNDHHSHLHSSSIGSNHLHPLVSTSSPSSAFLLNEETPLSSFSQELSTDICLTSSATSALELYQIDSTNGISAVQTIGPEGQPIGSCLLNNDSGDLCWNSLLGDDIPLVETTPTYSLVGAQSIACASNVTASVSLQSSVISMSTDPVSTAIITNVTSDSTCPSGKSSHLSENTQNNADPGTSSGSSAILDSKSAKPSEDHIASLDWSSGSELNPMVSHSWNRYASGSLSSYSKNELPVGNGPSAFPGKGSSNSTGSAWTGNDCKVSFESSAFDLDNFAELEQCTNY